MPSSHALVATFSAAAWAAHLCTGALSPVAATAAVAGTTAGIGGAAVVGSHQVALAASAALLFGAAGVSWLRVACGFHSVSQVFLRTARS